MRTRETVSGGFDTENLYEVCYPDGCSPNGITYSGDRRVKTITDTETPGFHKLRECGEFLPLNPVTIRELAELREPGIIDNDLSNGQHHQGRIWDAHYTVPLPVINPDLLNAAVLSAAANAAAAEMDVLTFLAEFRQTVGLLGDLYHRFNDGRRSIAREARKAKKNPWKAFRQYWLEARYGIRPIVYDVYNVANALSKKFENGLLLSGKGLQVEDLAHYEDTGWQPLNTYWDRRTTFERTGDRKYRGKAYVLFDSERSAKWGFNPLVTAWEKVPYTFVSDWFIDIGAWVQTLSPQLRGDYAGICESTKTEVYDVTKQYYRPVAPHNSGVTIVSSTQRITKEYIRAPTSVPFPPLLPQLTLPKVIDLFALAFAGRNDVNSIMSRR